LSSWIDRHAAFYDVPPLAMLRHCLDAISSLREIDLALTDAQASRLASMFRTDAANAQRMSLSNILPKSRRLIAAKPMQFCAGLLAPSEFEWARACTTKSTSRMAPHLPAMWFAAYRRRQAFNPLPLRRLLDRLTRRPASDRRCSGTRRSSQGIADGAGASLPMRSFPLACRALFFPPVPRDFALELFLEVDDARPCPIEEGLATFP
jgi:hypothetical protein